MFRIIKTLFLFSSTRLLFVNHVATLFVKFSVQQIFDPFAVFVGCKYNSIICIEQDPTLFNLFSDSDI